MTLSRKKFLGWIVTLMCVSVVFSFASVLLNGTLFFISDVDDVRTIQEPFRDLNVGESRLRRVNKKVHWVTNISPDQRINLQRLTDNEIVKKSGCDFTHQYCVLLAETQQSAITLQYTSTPPEQLPSKTPWFGGFVNPLNGNIYDLLGRAYVFQGDVEKLIVDKAWQ